MLSNVFQLDELIAMDDPDGPAPLHAGPSLLVATTLATLLVAAGAYVCRTHPRTLWPPYASGASHQPQALDAKSAPADQDAKDAKASRPKERRRRGRDPLKDLLKKKSKLLQVSKPSRSVEQERQPKPDEQPPRHDLEFSSRAPASATASTSTSTSSPSPATSPNTSPTLSQAPIESRTHSHDKPPRKPGTMADPWDWDGAGPSTDPHLTPQRHRNHKDTESRSSSSSSPSIAMLPALDEGEEEGAEPKMPNRPSVTSPTTTTPATPRRAPTPRDRRPPTPLSRSGTPPPQTQIASMRGALEAARLREEKLRADVERYSKEIEALRWDSARARRRESEASIPPRLQTQIHHLMNQVQIYGAMLSGQVSAHPLSHAHAPSTNGTSPTPSAPLNGYTTFSPPSSSPHSPPPPHLHIPSAQAQMLLNTILPSPTLPFHAPHAHPLAHAHAHAHGPPPFYAVPGGYPASPMQSPYGLYSMMFASMPGAAAAAAGGVGVGAGVGAGMPVEPGVNGNAEETRSVGSESPDMEGVGAGAGGSEERERGRRRTRRRTVGGRLGGWEWDGDGDGDGDGDENGIADGDGTADGWVGPGVPAGSGKGLVVIGELGEGYGDRDREREREKELGGEGEEEEEEGLNEVLADAILKRPGSIRGLSRLGKAKGGASAGGSGSGGAEREREVPLEEFRFPSISDYGNVVRAPYGAALVYETQGEAERGLGGGEQEQGEAEGGDLEERGMGFDDVREQEQEGEGEEDLTPPAAHPHPPPSEPTPLPLPSSGLGSGSTSVSVLGSAQDKVDG